MCGICGFATLGAPGSGEGAATGAAHAGDRAVLKAMCDVMAHRGPDGEGQWVEDGVALGHRRLALIDLEGGAQPLVRDGGEWAIVFNGEIYNYRELRAELQAAGYGFATDSDTEVLLAGYIAWGRGVLQRVRGMFAFAIWHRSTRELFCARDFFGIKPFYYTVARGARGPGQFVFASEIKAILEHPAYKRELNEQALAQYLCFQFSALEETFFKGVRKLAPGHCLTARADGTVEVGRYWEPRFEPDCSRPEGDTVDAIDAAMRESVRYHNVADVEVGSFLSSGIDSSYLAACLAGENPGMKTFTVGFAEYEGERDEVSWARDLANDLGMANDSKHVTEEEFWEAVPRVQWHMDEPSADPSAVALYFVDQLAARRVKAVLSGEGADEFFGGYRIYQAPIANAKIGWAPGPLLRLGSRAMRRMGKRGANYLERASEQVEDWYYTNANGVAFSPAERDELLAPALRERLAAAGLPSPQQLVAPVYARARVDGLDEPTRMQLVDLSFWLVGDILLKTDKMAMAHSLESRVPFLDREVFRLAASIPTGQKLTAEQTKVTLRKAAERAIPPAWAQKEKLGFPVPLASWLRQDRYYALVKRELTSATAMRFFNVRHLARLIDDHRAARADNSRRIWIIYSFLIWYRVFFPGAE